MPSKISYSLRLLTPADNDAVDKALKIFTDTTAPDLRTDTDQIRHKIAKPETAEGHFYFAAFYREENLIGFVMFGHYRKSRLVVIDHIAIAEAERKNAAFYEFVSLLQSEIADLKLGVDFIAVEVEDREFTDGEAGGREFVQLLTWIGFREVKTKYLLADMDAGEHSEHPGVLMLKPSAKRTEIDGDLLAGIYHSILFDHYFPWYRDFLEEDVDDYRKYLEGLDKKFRARVGKSKAIKLGGSKADQPPPASLPEDVRLHILHLAGLALFALIIAGVLLAVPHEEKQTAGLVLALLCAYAAFVLITKNRAAYVFKTLLAVLPVAKEHSRSRPGVEKKEKKKKAGSKG
ncbi:MAG TPA: hypothetical protein VMI56_24955 [Reyranella sp.]|nr:hypothetical protein [Reyranella sp.]